MTIILAVQSCNFRRNGSFFGRKSIENEKKNYFEAIKSGSLKEVLEEKLNSLELRDTWAGMFMVPSRGRKWSRRKRKKRNCLQQ